MIVRQTDEIDARKVMKVDCRIGLASANHLVPTSFNAGNYF